MGLTITHVPATNRSGNIAVGATAQNVYTADQQPKYGFEFYNTSDAVMYLDWDTDATVANGVPVPASGSYYLPGPGGVVPKGRMSVLCATMGKTFTCKTF